jgi:hypothetical protein
MSPASRRSVQTCCVECLNLSLLCLTPIAVIVPMILVNLRMELEGSAHCTVGTGLGLLFHFSFIHHSGIKASAPAYI